MAKRKPKSPPPAPQLPTSTSALAVDPKNPRTISDEAAAGLARSLERFGDLSGIVWNRRTGQLVAGHQRVKQIEARWGPRPIEITDPVRELGLIRADDSHDFAVRVVDWSPAKQRAANVAANNQKLQGAFSDDVATYLAHVEAELQVEMPGVVDDCLMAEFMLAEIADEEPDGKAAKQALISEDYQIIVQCTNEEHQREVYERLRGEGLACRVLTI